MVYSLFYQEYGESSMDNVLKYTELFDYYGNLLTEKEKYILKTIILKTFH